MDDALRKRISENVDRLIECTDYETLMHACVRRNLISIDMRQGIEHMEPSRDPPREEEVTRRRHKRLFHKITKRGPDAYDCLRDILRDLDNAKALRLLEANENENANANVSSSARPYKLPGSNSQQSLPHLGNDDNKRPPNKKENKSNNDDNDDNNANADDNDDDDDDDDETGVECDSEGLPILKLYTRTPKPMTLHVVKQATELRTGPNIYNMKSKDNRGIFFMVNIIDFPDVNDRRKGAKEDGESLLHNFKQCGFKLFAYNNLTGREFFHLLHEVLNSEYARDAECFAMALMTHGDMTDNVQHVAFRDGEVVKINRIMELFHTENCPKLMNKPKILIFPFCRGKRRDHGTPLIQTDTIPMGRPTSVLVPSLTDILLCHATNEGYFAHRDTTTGTWYISNFCKLMAEHAHDSCLEDILKMTHSETAVLRTTQGAMQMGSYTNIGFNKRLYFNPGISEADSAAV